MRVRAIDKDSDWTFGRGRANYVSGQNAIAQNVKTRLRSFERDWYLNVDDGIDWINLLGNLGTERRILRSVERTVLQTEGVLEITRLEIVRRDGNRGVTIRIDYTDVYSQSATETLELTA
jgi:hypothetical protein